MNVPNRLNHRRRIIYTALRNVLDKDPRIPKLFMLWDKQFGQASTFIVSSYIDLWMTAGLLKDQEKRDLSRALVQLISLDYDDLKRYPEEFVRPDSSARLEATQPFVQVAKTSSLAPVNLVPVNPEPVLNPEPVANLNPVVNLSPVAKPEPVLQTVLSSGQAVSLVSSNAVSQTKITTAKHTPEVVKISSPTQIPNLPPSYLIFRDTMQVFLGYIKRSQRSPENILESVLNFTQERQLTTLEPLLRGWSKQGFNLEGLPKLKDPKVMQIFIQMFYKVACDAATPKEQ
jgi:hypothetical protein